MDIHIWYTILSALVGGVSGARARLGEIRTIPLLRKRFETFPEAFFKNLVSSETKRLHFDKIFPEVSQDYKKLYAVIFSPMWNEIVKSLREEDYISNREMDLLHMPSNNGSLRFVQWPLFLISNKILLAIDYARESKDAQADLWSRILKDKYMTYAIQESYYCIEMILKCLVDGEARLRIDRIFREINSSILEGSLILTLSLEKLPSVLSRFTALTGLLIQGENAGNAMHDFYEIVIHEFLATDLREQHEMSSNSNHSRHLFSKLNPVNHEILELVKRMHLLLTVKESAANVPKNLEARRRLEFFTNSLFMDMPQAKPVCEMIPFSVFTPYFKETVLFSLSELHKENEDGISVLFYLKTVFKDEWKNFKERTKRQEDGEAKIDENSEYALELRFWASYRGQTLARTENDLSKIKLRLTQDYEPSLQQRAQADIKFTYVVSCQIYGKQKEEKTVQAADIGLLLQRNEALRVAFIHEEEIKTAGGKVSKEYFSKLVKADEHGKDQEIYSVKLPGNPKLGEGKPENQNHAIIFTRGEAIQTIDMNQACSFIAGS
ncbi:hypothetical protein Leryth_006646 [Lithospermum erythrorhizon]|nr:hypothetical protein Leryth_006646 [Lithospermum erythrorhizon]